MLKYDDLYRAELVKRKFIQENRMLPIDEPVKDVRSNYHLPAAGVELGMAIANLAKNVSVWKKRVNDPRYPDGEQKHAMYLALYQEAKTNARAEVARIQKLANEARNDD